MKISFENALGIYPQALALRSQRAAVIASNIANADTPSYKARDFDFRAALEHASASQAVGRLARTDAQHLPAPGRGGVEPTLLYRTPLMPAADGNTVDTQAEQAAFAENALNFQATFRFLNAAFVGLKHAIRGE